MTFFNTKNDLYNSPIGAKKYNFIKFLYPSCTPKMKIFRYNCFELINRNENSNLFQIWPHSNNNCIKLNPFD